MGDEEEAQIDEEMMGKLMNPQKELYPYEKVVAQNTEFFSTYNPDMIEEALITYLQNDFKVEPAVKEDKYKMRFVLQTKDMDGEDEETQMCIRMLSVEDGVTCVEF